MAAALVLVAALVALGVGLAAGPPGSRQVTGGGSASPSASATVSPSASAGRSSSAPAAPACQDGQLVFSAGYPSAAAGQGYILVFVRNAGSAPCDLQGVPTVAALDATGTPLGVPVHASPARVPSPTTTLPPTSAFNLPGGGLPPPGQPAPVGVLLFFNLTAAPVSCARPLAVLRLTPPGGRRVFRIVLTDRGKPFQRCLPASGLYVGSFGPYPYFN